MTKKKGLDLLETVVYRAFTRVKTHIVPEMYYTGLALTAGAIIDDYTAWGLLKSTAFAALSAGTIKGVQNGFNKYMPGLDINRRSHAEAILNYSIVAGTVATVCTAEALGLTTAPYISDALTLNTAGNETQTISTLAELGYLQLLSYGILETGLLIKAGIQKFTRAKRQTAKKIGRRLSYATAACAFGIGLTFAADVINPVSLDTITPFYALGIPASVDPAKLPPELKLKHSILGDYATVKLEKGNSLYTSIVLSHTDFLEHPDVMDAASQIMWKSYGIKNVWTGFDEILPTDELRIPTSLLSDRYKTEFKKPKAAKRLTVKPTNGGILSGIHVILDSGHGGTDSGAQANNVVEDETAYDVTSRIGTLLEKMGANVYYLVEDPHTKHTASAQLTSDKDELLLTKPNYEMRNAKASANLRVYLTNSIYYSLIHKGVSPDAIVYTSFHVDALSPHAQGMMVYYPEASLRNSSLRKSGKPYTRYSEFNQDPTIEIESDKERSEAQSHSLAELIITSAHSNDLGIGIVPVRGSIHRGRQTYVPAVLRWNPVPQKVLVELANCVNRSDAQVLRDDDSRQTMAQTYVDAIVAFYKGGRR
ncbi:MAG: N-acetylmuramoyl-L-alanine amidase [Candidatus Woesearchaeota archaeon]|jgi:N-acetylmuramoyl-L-alanine amidase